MNLEESNAFVEEEAKKDKKKKGIIIGMVLCAVLIALLFALILTIRHQDALTLKMFINGTKVNIPSDFFYETNNITYVNVSEVSNLLGYTYTKGEYNKYNEDEKSCYLSGDYEVISLTADANKYKKYTKASPTANNVISELNVVVKSDSDQAENFATKDKIEFINDSIYVPFDNLPEMFNLQIDTSEDYRIKIYNLEYLVENAKNVLSNTEYQTISGTYENLRAIPYGLIVVSDGKQYGVVSLSTGKPVISIKYDDINFVQNVKEFLVNANNTVGIFSQTGSVVIPLSEYDEISIYDDEKQLYLVKDKRDYGVINNKGETVVFLEYDEIGYENMADYDLDESEGKLLFDEYIPVQKNKKYGLFDLKGNQVLTDVYDELGYRTEKSSRNGEEESVLLIPESVGIKGIVVNFNNQYGIFDATEGALLIPCVCSKIYSITKSGQTTYYMEYNGEQINIENYLEENNLKNIKNDTTKDNTNLTDEDTNSENTSTVDDDEIIVVDN